MQPWHKPQQHHLQQVEYCVHYLYQASDWANSISPFHECVCLLVTMVDMLPIMNALLKNTFFLYESVHKAICNHCPGQPAGCKLRLRHLINQALYSKKSGRAWVCPGYHEKKIYQAMLSIGISWPKCNSIIPKTSASTTFKCYPWIYQSAGKSQIHWI